MAAAERFHDRFRKVLDYIDAHLADDLAVERLSDIAAFSQYHFQRQFSELFGLGIYQYVQLSRLKRAGHRLAYRSQQSVAEIALDSGYEGPEAFARAFRKRFGQSPTQFRKQPQWQPWYAINQQLSELRNTHMKPVHSLQDVTIIDFKATRVAVLEHRGDPARIGDSIRRFIEWRKQNRLPPRISATFNIAYDDPETVEPGQYRMDLCAATEQDVCANAQGVVSGIIPAGRCARLRHTGSDDALRQSVHYLYATWLPASGEEPRDYPLFFQRVRFFPDVPEHEAVTDVLLPLK